MDRIFRRTACILLVLLTLISAVIPALASGYKAYFSSSARVYARASASSPSVRVGKGTKVTIVAIKGDVAMIRRDGITAYCDVRNLTLSSPIHVYAKRSCKVYARASSSSKSMTIGANTDLYIVGKSGSYLRVRNKGGSVTAYIKASDVSSSKVKTSSSGAKKISAGSGKAGRVLSAAASLVGRPYSDSCDPPRSFDCSNFVSYCFKQVGVSVSKSAKQLGYSNHTRITSASKLKAGDILVFNTNPNDDDLSDHVGIYIGGGRFVHASSSRGQVVVSSFSSYYVSCFSWALRVL